jgi:Fe(3+) dicitrate transport protein
MQPLKRFIFLSVFLLSGLSALMAQSAWIRGKVSVASGETLEEGYMYIRKNGKWCTISASGSCILGPLPPGTYEVTAFALGYAHYSVTVTLDKDTSEVEFPLKKSESRLEDITIEEKRIIQMASGTLKDVEDMGIYAARKSEVVEMKNLTVNTANNNSRQVFGRITGLNIWESDGTGLQLGIGGRGLSPNRTSNFNTRQNGYDISADALGYPESYYTPPMEALERIEVVRGAASLQYGTQFGGMLNFKMKQGPEDTPLEVTTRLSGGSFGFLNSFTSLGGTFANNKVSYYSFYQRKEGNGWRPNSRFEVNTAYSSWLFRMGKATGLKIEYTHLDYIAQQPGGLTDTYFANDPRQSVRNRNWFKVNWNLFSACVDGSFNLRTRWNSRFFGLLASRQSLGNLERINVADFGGNRTLIEGDFRNIGNESRIMHAWKLGNQEQTILAGVRVYRGNTTARQGDANRNTGPDFVFNNPGNLENSDYIFPNLNIALFTEQVFRLSEKWVVSPGLRWEFIQTEAEGYYKQRVTDYAGNLISETKFQDRTFRPRSFLLGGLGTSFRPNPRVELYGNFSQNYRAINFSDIRINNPNLVVDPNLKDEKGFTADLGAKGGKENFFRYEITLFYLAYQDRIGQVLRADRPPLFLDYRYRTNISDARNIGIELFGEVNILKVFYPQTSNQLNVFANMAFIDARYIRSNEPGINGNFVEMVSPAVIRTGISWKYKNFRLSGQHSFTEEHFSDASNAVRTSTSVEGIIPAYSVLDVSLAWTRKNLTLEGSLNNALDERYFTRRAESYPGPGIIPSDGRNLTLTLQYQFRVRRKP